MAQKDEVLHNIKRRYTLSKNERLCSKKLIEKLFLGGISQSMLSYPLRVVYFINKSCDIDNSNTILIKMMVSVSKKYFKHAVKRNRIKRQIREAYRKNKYILIDKLNEKHCKGEFVLAFIWVGSSQKTTNVIEDKVINLLQRIRERL